MQSLYRDNPHTADEYGKQFAQITDKATRERLMFGNWEYDDDPSALIDYDAIVDLFTNTVPDSNEKYLTADIARYGGDRIVIRCWKGFLNHRTIVRQKQGDRSDRAAHPRDLGRGADPVLARSHRRRWGRRRRDRHSARRQSLRERLKPARAEVQASRRAEGAVPKPEDAVHLPLRPKRRTLTGWRSVPTTPRSASSRSKTLEQMKSKDADKDGKKKIVPKEEVKERLGRSPDFGDSLMMRMWFELAPKRSEFVPPPVTGLVQPFYPNLGV